MKAADSKYRCGFPECPSPWIPVISMVYPIAPAPPHRRAHALQPIDATIPSATRVSIVVDPCRPALHAAVRKGHPHQKATGTESAPTAHCHPENCQPGIIDNATIGVERTRATQKRRRRSATRALAARAAASSAPLAASLAWTVRSPASFTVILRKMAALYPAFSTAPTRSSSEGPAVESDSST